ncbi:hypothetical protein ACQ4PT_005825 [Festuca glaucescens]
MENFPVLPFRYLPGPLSIDHGPPDRLQRSVLVVSDPPLQHDEYAIITVSADILDINKEAMLDEVCNILARDHGAPVTFPRVYPLGVGLVRFASPVVRDRMINTSPHTLDSDEEMTFSVIRHDEGLNRGAHVFQHEAWVMFLMFPLDYQTTYYVNKVVSLFGKLLVWHNPRVNKVRVTVKVPIKELRLVPFSLLMTQAGNFFGAEGGSWSIPVYILDGRAVAPEAVGNEEPVPPMNVTPHPYELPFLNDLQQHHLNLQVWNQQNADVAWEQEVGEASGDNIAMEVDWVPAGTEGMVGSSTLRSILFVNVAGFQFNVSSFIALVKFLGCRVYTNYPCLDYGMEVEPLHCMTLSLEDGGLQLEVETDVVVTGRRRGRPRKQATPQVESQVKRSLRRNSQGYNHWMLPYLTSKPKISTVKVAYPPEVQQVAEMQRIGVEECLIDHAALTEEKLLKQREDQE